MRVRCCSRHHIDRTHHPENEETQEVSRSDPSTRRQTIRDVVIPVPEDPAHKDCRDSTAVVRLRCEIDDRHDRSDQNV